jgi:5-methylcytosine-specific restriction endonuclease McrA
MFGWLRRTADDLFGARSGRWPKVRRDHLAKNPACAACGKTDGDMEVHHIRPISRGGDELDPRNLITLCADPCHLVHGHLMGWSRQNEEVVQDCTTYRSKVEKAKHD